MKKSENMKKSEDMGKSNVVHKMALINGLRAECPLDKHLVDCPIKKVRGLSLEGLFDSTESRDKTELDLVISHHQYCFQRRRRKMLCENKD
ncbi:hypothetical protein KJ742_01075 [Patescibacteria group bacterium]|nr:hypothetical protein [Patescibacteria group bacterium]